MESRDYKEELRDLILDMAHKELENHVSKKGAQKYFEGNVDKVIDNNIKKIGKERSLSSTYSKIIKQATYQENMSGVAKVIRKEALFKSKNELARFAKYLGLDVNLKNSYKQIIKRVSKHIYSNRDMYSRKYVLYKRGEDEFIIEPERIKTELVESYRSKTREDMKSIAKLLDLDVTDEEGAEDIRKKVINYIIKDKLAKKRK